MSARRAELLTLKGLGLIWVVVTLAVACDDADVVVRGGDAVGAASDGQELVVDDAGADAASADAADAGAGDLGTLGTDAAKDASDADAAKGAGDAAGAGADDADSAAAAAAKPVGVVTVKQGQEVIPQTVLNLLGSASASASGCTVAKYAWTVKQPEGSTQVFVPGSNFPNPTFTANVAGEYTFCLSVQCAGAATWSAPACLTVSVIPEDAIHVELLWQTPGDPDPLDSGPGVGADLDLHVANPLAAGADLDCDGAPDPWMHPNDLFWFNPNPDWSALEPSLKGSMDLDDTDGSGPENINIMLDTSPENPLTFTIGVHVWNDHCFGPSLARVNVYIAGLLVAQIDSPKLHNLEMWTVGKIHWPNVLVDPTSSAVPFTSCKQSAPPCAGGQMWLDAGAPCVTAKYTNPAFTATQGGGVATACSP